MNLIYCIIFSILLVGCNTLPPNFCKKDEVSIVVQDKPIHIDPKLYEPCKDLVELPSIDPLVVLPVTATNASVYVDCKNKNQSLINTLRDFSNKK